MTKDRLPKTNLFGAVQEKRKVGRSALTWFDEVIKDITEVGVNCCLSTATDWRQIVEQDNERAVELDNNNNN